jgi:acyl-CoA synthetase (AMP-forming)/AMP-acid ligase II
VIGVTDKNWREALFAYLVHEENTKPTFREISLFLRAKIADFKIPSDFSVIEELPQNASGKILRRHGRKKHWKNYDRLVN